MDGRKTLLIVYLVFHILGGHVGMVLVLFTAFWSRQVVRHACFVNFCVTWLLFSVSYVFLLYAGQILEPDPPLLLCTIQAAMSYASAPMTSVSSFIFVLHIYHVLQAAIKRGSLRPFKWPKLTLTLMLVTPYLVYLAVFIAVLIYGRNNPQQIRRTTFYCDVESRVVSSIPPGISAIVTFAVIVVEVMISIMLYRNWKTFRGNSVNINGLTLQLLIRSFIFTAFAVTALLTCVVLLANTREPLTAIVTSCLPMGVFLLFGTQPDLLRAWHVRKKDGNASQTGSRDPESVSSTPTDSP